MTNQKTPSLFSRQEELYRKFNNQPKSIEYNRLVAALDELNSQAVLAQTFIDDIFYRASLLQAIIEQKNQYKKFKHKNLSRNNNEKIKKAIKCAEFLKNTIQDSNLEYSKFSFEQSFTLMRVKREIPQTASNDEKIEYWKKFRYDYLGIVQNLSTISELMNSLLINLPNALAPAEGYDSFRKDAVHNLRLDFENIYHVKPKKYRDSVFALACSYMLSLTGINVKDIFPVLSEALDVGNLNYQYNFPAMHLNVIHIAGGKRLTEKEVNLYRLYKSLDSQDNPKVVGSAYF